MPKRKRKARAGVAEQYQDPDGAALKRKSQARPRGKRQAPERVASRRRAAPVGAAFDWIMQALMLSALFLLPVVMDPRARTWTLAKDALIIWLAAAMALVWLLSALRQGRFSWRRSMLNGPVLAVVAAAAISIIPSRYRAMGEFPLAELAAFAVFCFCVLNWAADRARAERLLWAAAAGMLVVGIYGTLQRYGIDFMTYPTRQVRILSFQGNATFLAGYLVVLLPLLWVFGLGLHRGEEESGAGRRWGFAKGYQAAARAGFLLAEACLIWTWTRAAFAGVLVGLTALVVLVRWNPLKALREMRRRFDLGQAAFVASAVGLAVVLVTLAPANLKGVMRNTASALSIAVTTGTSEPVRALIDPGPAAEGPGQEEVLVPTAGLATEVQWTQRRIHMWQAAFHTFKANPLWGAGLGTYQIYMRSYPWSAAKHQETPEIVGALHAHNEFLETLSDEGILGEAAFLFLLGVYVLMAVRVLRRGNAFWRAVVAGLLAGVVALLVQNLFAISFRQAGVVVYFWLALGLTATAEIATREGEPARGSFRLPALRGGATAAGSVMSAALLSVLALWLILVPLRAERYMFLAANALRNKQTAYAAAMLEKQIALTPKRPEPWAMLGPLYGMMSESVSDPAQKQALLKKSLRTLEHADVLCPNYRNVRRNIAAALSRLGKTREAIKVLERAAKVQDASWLYADMARNYVTLGDLAAAEASARKAVQESSKDPEHIHLLGYVLAREGKKLEAIEQFKMASALEPEAARNYVAMGYAYVDIGRRQEGIAALRKALGLAVPGSSDERLAEGGLTRLGQPLVPQ